MLTTMRARDPAEAHRTTTPLELLFDLTFVVAVAAVVGELAHAIAGGHPAEAVVGYAVVFFGIWWAWMNFTWFASAFDCDDAFYRVLTMVQMAGVLVVAAGVGPAFGAGDFGTAVAGYVIMRIALVAQWLRVARSVPEYRDTALRFAIGVVVVQALWIARLALPPPLSIISVGLLGLAELGIPYWAERSNMTPWHPHHIAERYGLFTIIVLGEGVLAASNAVLRSKSEVGLSVELSAMAIAGLVLLFALWWLYFLESAAPRLEERRDQAFLWGYGHFFVFASLAAVGAGLDVTAEAITHPIEASGLLVGYSVALPVALYLLVLWALHAVLGGARRVRPALPFVEVGVILLIPMLSAWLTPAWVVALIAAAAAGLVIAKSVLAR